MKVVAIFLCWFVLPSWAGSIEVQRDVPILKTGAKATVFSLAGKDAKVEALSVLQLRRAQPGASEEVSVRDLLSDVNRLPPEMLPKPSSDFLLVNGGFSSEPTSRPAGLLITGGRTLSTPSYSRVKGLPQSSCEYTRSDRFRLSALLCVPKDGSADIRNFNGESFKGCHHALQAGPLLIEESKSAICRPSSSSETSIRTSLCITGDAAMDGSFKVVVTQTPIALYDLATWMQAAVDQGGLGCKVAMNLGGENSSAAALFKRGRSQLAGPSFVIGDGTYPQASFITISTR
jgi:hypothetical protein